SQRDHNHLPHWRRQRSRPQPANPPPPPTRPQGPNHNPEITPMNLRDLIRNWLGLTDLRNELQAIGYEIHMTRTDLHAVHDRVIALESSGLADIRTVADVAQGLP